MKKMSAIAGMFICVAAGSWGLSSFIPAPRDHVGLLVGAVAGIAGVLLLACGGITWPQPGIWALLGVSILPISAMGFGGWASAWSPVGGTPGVLLALLGWVAGGCALLPLAAIRVTINES